MLYISAYYYWDTSFFTYRIINKGFQTTIKKRGETKGKLAKAWRYAFYLFPGLLTIFFFFPFFALVIFLCSQLIAVWYGLEFMHGKIKCHSVFQQQQEKDLKSPGKSYKNSTKYSLEVVDCEYTRSYVSIIQLSHFSKLLLFLEKKKRINQVLYFNNIEY